MIVFIKMIDFNYGLKLKSIILIKAITSFFFKFKNIIINEVMLNDSSLLSEFNDDVNCFSKFFFV